MNVDDLIKTIGLEHTNSEVQRILKELGLQNKKVKLKRGDFDVGLEALEYGVDINFSDPSQFDLPKSFPDGGLVLSNIFFMSEGYAGHRQFPAALPRGLEFSMSRTAVRQLLGPPDWINPHFPIDRWQYEGMRMVATFYPDEQSVKQISIGIPKTS